MLPPKFQPHVTSTGFTLPSIHACPPFFCLQMFPSGRKEQEELWRRLLLSYARHRRLFTLSTDDARKATSQWHEALTNERINRSLSGQHLGALLEALVGAQEAAYEPPKQTSSVLLYWRKPEEWAEILHKWVVSTGQLNTILTFYEIQNPPVPSELSDIPLVLLKRAVSILAKTNRAQSIESAEGGGARFFGGG